jgi:hypothetical protein
MHAGHGVQREHDRDRQEGQDHPEARQDLLVD